jgi:hypothetical protein
VGGQLDDLATGPDRHEQAATRVVEADAIRPAGQVVPPPGLDAGADREHEQGVAARVGHVAPRRRRAAVQARDVCRAKAGRRAADEPAARVAQLEDALAAQQDHRSPVRQSRGLAGRPCRRGQLAHAGRPAAGERPQRGDTEREAGA